MKGKCAFFVQVRLGSTRLPGKVLKPVLPGLTLIEMVDRRIRRSRYYDDNLYYLTTNHPSDNRLAAFFKESGWNYIRGDTLHVFNRFRAACETVRPEYFFRICADNPFLEPEFLDQLGDAACTADFDYISFRDRHGTPVIRTHFGVFAEVINTGTLLSIDPGMLSVAESEHVTPVFYGHADTYRLQLLDIPRFLRDDTLRFTVDTQEDLDIVSDLTAALGPDAAVRDLVAYCAEHSEYSMRMKRQIERNRK